MVSLLVVRPAEKYYRLGTLAFIIRTSPRTDELTSLVVAKNLKEYIQMVGCR
jgi:hypothetical protein